MKKLIPVLMGVLSAVMAGQEVLILQTLAQSGGLNAGALLKSLSLLLLYLVPLLLLGVFMMRKEQKFLCYFLLAFLSGGFLIGSLSGLLNYELTNFLVNLIPNKAITEHWMPSVVPPVVEELLKLAVALLVIHAAGFRTLRSWMGIGLAAGLGFQFLEDYAYILATVIEGGISPLSQSLLRIESAYATHWLLTALFAGACFLLIHRKKMWKNPMTYVWLLAPWLLHVSWNSPFIDNNMVLKLTLSVIGWLLLLGMFLYSREDSPAPAAG